MAEHLVFELTLRTKTLVDSCLRLLFVSSLAHIEPLALNVHHQ